MRPCEVLLVVITDFQVQDIDSSSDYLNETATFSDYMVSLTAQENQGPRTELHG